MPEPEELSRATLLTMTSLYLRTVPQVTTDELAKPAHLFAVTIYDKAKESGINPAELSYALCELLSALAPKQFQEDITELGVVTLGALVAKQEGEKP